MNRAFTMVEILIAALCLMLVLIPVFQVLQSGTKSSLQGMLRVDTTLEARRILRQIQKDLKAACFELSVENSGDLDFSTILKTQGTLPLEYRFLAFPTLGSPGDFVKEGETLVSRQLSQINYIVKKSENQEKPFLQLIREEHFGVGHPLATAFPNGCRRTVLSERVNFFQIVTRDVDTAGPFYTHSFFWVTLQLVDSLKASRLANEVPETAWKNPAEGLVLADFYDVVYPEFFNSLQDWSFMNRNWYNKLEWKAP